MTSTTTTTIRTSTTTNGAVTSSTTTNVPVPTGGTAPPETGFRVRLNPSGQRIFDDPDWPVWTVAETASQSKTINGVSLTLSVSGTVLDGARYKLVQQRAAAGMGEKMVGEAMTSDAQGSPVTLTIKGLSAGTHTLTTWHNAPHNLQSVAALTISVNGNNAASVGVFMFSLC